MADGRPGRRGTNGLVLFVLGILAVLLSFLLRVPCRVPEWSVDSRFPGLCAAELQPGDLSVTPGGMLSGFFTGGPTGDQPIVVGMFTSILGWMTTGLAEAFSFEITPNTVLDLTVFLTALVWVVTITAVASLSGKQPSDPVVLAFAPTVLLVGFTSWDLWAVMFMMLAVASYIRGSPGVAGVWIGLGATVSFLPLLVLIAILFLAARYRYLGDFISALVVSLIVFAMVNGPFMVQEFDRWRERMGETMRSPVSSDSGWSVWNALGAPATGLSIDPANLDQVSMIAILLGVVAVLLVTVLAGKEPSIVQVLLMLLAVFLLFSRDWSLLQSVWLVPLVILARRSWLEFFLWQAVEIGYWATMNAPAGAWETQPLFGDWGWSPQALLAAARYLFLIWFIVIVAVDMQRGRRATQIGVAARNA